MEVATNEIVAIGPHQYVNKINKNNKKLYHCILCQEDEAISVKMPPMVLCTYVQLLTVPTTLTWCLYSQ